METNLKKLVQGNSNRAGAERPSRKAGPARGSSSTRVGHLRSAKAVWSHLELQRLCIEFRIPKHFSESIALLCLIHSMEKASPPLAITEASLVLRLPGATTANKMREMTAKELMILSQDPHDKRRFHPRLTAKGYEFVLAVLHVLEKQSGAGEDPSLERQMQTLMRRTDRNGY